MGSSEATAQAAIKRYPYLELYGFTSSVMCELARKAIAAYNEAHCQPYDPAFIQHIEGHCKTLLKIREYFHYIVIGAFVRMRCKGNEITEDMFIKAMCDESVSGFEHNLLSIRNKCLASQMPIPLSMVCPPVGQDCCQFLLVGWTNTKPLSVILHNKKLDFDARDSNVWDYLVFPRLLGRALVDAPILPSQVASTPPKPIDLTAVPQPISQSSQVVFKRPLSAIQHPDPRNPEVVDGRQPKVARPLLPLTK